jgi:hypothetical protein
MASSEHLFFPETRKRRSPGNSYHNADKSCLVTSGIFDGFSIDAYNRTIFLASKDSTVLPTLAPPPFSLIWNFGSASDLPSNLDPNLICSSEVASAYLIGLTPTTREKKRPWVVGRCVSYKVGLLCLRRPLPASCLDAMADPPVSLVSTTCGFQINQIVGWVRGLA